MRSLVEVALIADDTLGIDVSLDGDSATRLPLSIGPEPTWPSPDDILIGIVEKIVDAYAEQVTLAYGETLAVEVYRRIADKMRDRVEERGEKF